MPLDQLPDEIFQHLLYYVSPRDTLVSLQLASRRLRNLVDEPLLWRYHCLTSFRFWNPDHDIQSKLRLPPSQVDWKRLFVRRSTINSRVLGLLDDIIATSVGHLSKIEQTCWFGYDAKDVLLEQCRTEDTADDVLARRYYANAILDSIHKHVAIGQWHHLWTSPGVGRAAEPGERQLERSLGAFDMFVLHNQPGDLDDISSLLDGLATQFRMAHSAQDDSTTTRQRALALNRWLRANNLTGLAHAQRDYRNLRNCLIGQALRHDEHESIPIISSAIFCCVAERLGMDTQCCAFPSHVLAVVTANPGQTLDDVSVNGPGHPRQRMYLDPFGSNGEVPTESLSAILARFGQENDDHLLDPVPASAIVARTARNMEMSAARISTQTRAQAEDPSGPALSRLMHGSDAFNARACRYASAWSLLMLNPPTTFDWKHRFNTLMELSPTEDAWLVERYLRPRTAELPALTHLLPAPVRPSSSAFAWDIWRRSRDGEVRPPRPSARDTESTRSVPFKVGQVIRHTRYGWTGIVIGWDDPKVSAAQGEGETPMAFFTCLSSTDVESYHYIRSDNIEPIHNPDQVDESMFPMAGKYFRRFDRATCSFVSNIKEQYPDD